ncbi:MAG: CoA-disulfide reductase [Erysipelotrichia bacterium]|jgi:NADPH-dependent 2,4-dienoyl-CoA reductase/sulfur reductase-like enzyme|nr:CoA-disulfide reductase [Erysipelotrichia bacterium]
MKTIIIGGVAAGMSVAAKLRREVKDETIIVLEKTDTISYGACGLPYYVSGENPDITRMNIRSVQQMRDSGIDVRIFHEVTKLDPVAKKVFGHSPEGDFELEYDRCVIASGASPIVPKLSCQDTNKIFTLKTLNDGEKLKAAFASSKRIGIIGGGYIGLELVEAAVHNQKEVVLVEKADRVLNTFDGEFSKMAYEELIKNHVEVYTSESLVDVVNHEQGLKIITDQRTLEVDIVILALGVRPNTSFTKDSGIALASNGAVLVDTTMKTNVKDVYAAGDCSVVTHMITHDHRYLPLGTNANKQGRNLAEVLAGAESDYALALGSAMLRLCGLEFAKTGLSEQEAMAAKLDVVTTFVTSHDHPRYYPNATDIHIKLVADANTGILLGAQLAGEKNTALRSHAYSVAISARMSAKMYANLDLGYAPPFATTYDVTQIAAQTIKARNM